MEIHELQYNLQFILCKLNQKETNCLLKKMVTSIQNLLSGIHSILFFLWLQLDRKNI